ncbi:MAG: ABC transporter substrate-binding protein [Bacilli bacterium]
MKNKAFLLKAGLVAVLGASTAIGLASCGEDDSSITSGDTSVEITSEEESTGETTSGVEQTIDGSPTGAYSYVDSDYDEKTDILANLEEYAYKNNLTGLPLYENGSYVMYNTRVVKGTNNYIPGYGFGILGEGSLSGPLASESVDAYKNYYHTWDSNDPQTINYLDNDGSQVSNLFANISSSYWGTKMNSTKDGYDWYGVLAKEDRPIPLDEDGNEITDVNSQTLASKWKFHVRTGEDGLKYSTLSSVRSEYNGRGVELDDYLVPFKLLLTKKNDYYRGSELASQEGSSGIKGAAAYYNASADGFSAEAFDGVGVKADPADNSITIELLAPTTQFSAMYTLASSLYEPIPEDFIDEVGADSYGAFNSADGTTPVDNILSLAPYTLEYWETDKTITFKRNDEWFERDIEGLENRYTIEGIHYDILTAYDTDSDAAIKEFLNGNLDAASLTLTFLDQYKSDPRTTSVPGDSTFKLNMNTCTEETWEELFGTNGTITQTQESDYWDVKPWMSNDDFLDGLLLSINREEFAENRGYVPSVDYFASAYMSNPEEGISYDSTDQHQQVLENVFGDAADTYGYDLETAKAKFKSAVEELVASGDIVEGTKENPTTITLDIWWMSTDQISTTGDDIVKYIEDAFNDEFVSDGKVVLDINQEAVTTQGDVYYQHLMVGQFDLGFGSISGNTLDPLNFMEVLKSDNSSGFTLNWGSDTSEVILPSDEENGSDALVYDNKVWSFDTLWKAADQGVLVNNAIEVDPVAVKLGEFTDGEDGSRSYTLKVSTAMDNEELTGAEENDFTVEITEISVFDLYESEEDIYLADATVDDSNNTVATGDYDAETGDLTVNISADQAAALPDGVLEVVVYYKITINGVFATSYVESSAITAQTVAE